MVISGVVGRYCRSSGGGHIEVLSIADRGLHSFQLLHVVAQVRRRCDVFVKVPCAP